MYNVSWQIHINQEMTGIHGFVPILSGLCCCVEFNMLQPDSELMYSWKYVHLVKCCHFEVIYHDVVIRGSKLRYYAQMYRRSKTIEKRDFT